MEWLQPSGSLRHSTASFRSRNGDFQASRRPGQLSQAVAAARKCPHLGFNLCRGSLEGAAVVCPLHKAKFDLATGAIERDPKLLFINMKAKTGLKVYPVKVLDQDIFVGV